MQRLTTVTALLIVFALGLGACAAAEPAPTPTATLTPVGNTDAGALGPDPFEIVERIVERVSPSVVTILTPQGIGSGVIYNSDGVVVTNNHVVEPADEWVVAFASGERLDAELLGTDPLTDVAVLRVQRSGLPAADFNPELPNRGTLAIAMGSPLGFLNSVTVGVVSGVGRAIPGAPPSLVDLIQTDAAISPGNSGGALVGDDGAVMGINVAHIPPQARAETIGFAIPAGTVVDVVDAILAGQPVEHAYLGVSLAQVTPAMAEELTMGIDSGAAVIDIEAGGPAAESALEVGDVIVGAGGEPVRTVEELLTRLRQASPGDEMELTVVRSGEEMTVAVTLGQRPPQQAP